MDGLPKEYYKCFDCGMKFHNTNMLEKHRERFCLSDYRRNFKDEKVLQLEELKRQRAKLRTLRDRAEKRWYHQTLDRDNWNGRASQLKLLQARARVMKEVDRSESQNSSLDSVSIAHADESDTDSPYGAEAKEDQERRRQLETNIQQHSDNLAKIKLQSMKLQHQRNEITRSLGELSLKGFSDSNTELDYKRSPLDYGKSKQETNLLVNIAALKQSYMQGGGDDPNIVAQMNALEEEAMSINNRRLQKRITERNRTQERATVDTLLKFEHENDRLLAELLAMQEMNNKRMVLNQTSGQPRDYEQRQSFDRLLEMEQDIKELQELQRLSLEGNRSQRMIQPSDDPGVKAYDQEQEQDQMLYHHHQHYPKVHNSFT